MSGAGSTPTGRRYASGAWPERPDPEGQERNR